MWKIEKIISKGNYNYVIVHNHPHATKHGYVLEHRIVMENYLGRLLNSKEVVHHKNGNTKDNHLENLEVMLLSEHSRGHQNSGRKMIELICPACGVHFIREKRHLNRKKNSCTCCSSRCRGIFSRKIQLFGKTLEVERAISVNIVREFNSLDNTEQTVK